MITATISPTSDNTAATCIRAKLEPFSMILDALAHTSSQLLVLQQGETGQESANVTRIVDFVAQVRHCYIASMGGPLHELPIGEGALAFANDIGWAISKVCHDQDRVTNALERVRNALLSSPSLTDREKAIRNLERACVFLRMAVHRCLLVFQSELQQGEHLAEFILWVHEDAAGE